MTCKKRTGADGGRQPVALMADGDYGRAFIAALMAVGQSWLTHGEISSLELEMGAACMGAVTDVRRAGVAAWGVLGHLVESLLPELTDTAAILPNPGERTEQLTPGECQAVQAVCDLVPLRESPGSFAAYVARALARGEREPLMVSIKVNRTATEMGIKAYLEAVALLLRLEELRPPDFAQAYVLYYASRRADSTKMLAASRLVMVHGWGAANALMWAEGECLEDESAGPLYRKARTRYRNLPSVEMDAAIGAYCDAFLEALDRLPVEALLCPNLAIAWALRAGGWAGDRQASADGKVSTQRQADIVGERPLSEALAGLRSRAREPYTVEELADDGATPLELLNDSMDNGEYLVVLDQEDSVNTYCTLPGYDLAIRHYGDAVPLSVLAAELGISKPAVHKRIQKFLALARKA